VEAKAGRVRPVYVVLAAGASRRMGFDKIVTPLAGAPPLARVVSALVDRELVLVVPSRLAAEARRIAPAAAIATNDEPERGMTRSLQLGLALVPRDRAFGVVPADLAAMTAQTIASTEALLAEGAQVAHPIDADGVPGHPVLFAAAARAIVDVLPEGDTLRRARDDASLWRATWLCADRSAFLDLDEPSDWERWPPAT
jgi:molybdenum cofactor cytidylyltransferase